MEVNEFVSLQDEEEDEAIILTSIYNLQYEGTSLLIQPKSIIRIYSIRNKQPLHNANAMCLIHERSRSMSLAIWRKYCSLVKIQYEWMQWCFVSNSFFSEPTM